jgi:hypothetical protein
LPKDNGNENIKDVKRVRSIPVDRPLTSEEYKLTRWMLEHGTPEAAAFLEQLERVHVVGKCPCGCASIDFEIEGLGKAPPGVHVLGDFIYGDESNLCGVFVFESGGILSGIEVTGYAVDAPKTIPNPSQLRSFNAPQKCQSRYRRPDTDFSGTA